MIILEILGEIIARIFVEILFQGIIMVFFRLIKKGYDAIKTNLFGIKINKEPVSLIKTIENKFLYKDIELIEDLNSTLKAGNKGIVLEIIDENSVFAEFYNKDGIQIEENNELVFEISMNQFKLKN